MAVGPRTLAYRTLGLGDLLTAVPALRALVRARGHVTLAAPAPLQPLVELIGDLSLVPTRELAPPPYGADLAVNLHGRGPQSRRVLLESRPRRLITFGDPAGPRWRAGEHEVVRWCRLLEESGIPADPGDLHLDVPPSPLARPGATVIHPGAASPSRRWPPERFAEVAAAEHGAGREVLITGGPEERELARTVAHRAGLPEECVLAGRTDLVALAGVVAAAGRVVCGDTGVAHLATAVRTPSVLLFGPTSPAEWGPPPDGPHHVLWAGRTGDPHGREADPGLLQIGPEDVTALLH